VTDTKPSLLELGYWLSSEEHDPKVLVRNAARAEEVGFRLAGISDHFHPLGSRTRPKPLRVVGPRWRRRGHRPAPRRLGRHRPPHPHAPLEQPAEPVLGVSITQSSIKSATRASSSWVILQ
jgi:hypothetical protein